MFISRHGPDLCFRIGGLVLLGICAVALRHLHQLAGSGTAMTPAGMALAAIGFLTLSAGAALTAIGAHILDEVEVSSPWF